jgi:ABC-type glycerol-3-phosphate transport system permease component
MSLQNTQPAAVAAAAAPPASLRAARTLRTAALYLALIGLSVVFMIPLFWMISTALKARFEVFAYPPEVIPSNIQWGNFREIFTRVPLGRYMLNTVLLVVANIAGQLLAVPLVAYAFARLRFPGREAIFFVVIATMMVPTQVTLIPLYTLYQRLGMVDTYWPLILPAFFGNPFFIFLMRQYIKTLPRDLDDAARIDGAGTWGILYRIILPLCVPPLTIIMVYQFLWTWNDFIEPLIYISNTDMYTLQLGLSMFRGRFTVEWHLLMAAALVSVVPQLVVYFFAQRQLIGGIASVGLKG